MKCSPDQSNKLKDRLNKIASNLKSHSTTWHHKLKRIGHYCNGHLYGLPKVHKSSTDPPLRPIISMVGTVTHDISQHLNKTLRPYLDATYMVKSSDEILADLSSLRVHKTEKIVSLDVESLFTSVPVMETIDLILERSYHHPNLPPPSIEKDLMR